MQHCIVIRFFRKKPGNFVASKKENGGAAVFWKIWVIWGFFVKIGAVAGFKKKRWWRVFNIYILMYEGGSDWI